MSSKQPKDIDKNNSISKTDLGHPVHNEPAFILKKPRNGSGNVLIIADLHFGIEHSLELAGARLPSQTERITEHVLQLCSKLNISQLILLGDIKHTVPKTSRQEWRELPMVFSHLSAAVESIEIIPGNHDGNLKKLIPNEVKNIHIHPISGTILHGIGLFHGHTWPSVEVLKTELVLMAHNHPNVLFVDKLGGRVSYSCWVRGYLDSEKTNTRFSELNMDNPEIIIMPAFNDIGSGTPINAPKPEFLGPMLKNRMVDLDNANVYLLDGTDLGKLKKLVDLNQIKK